MSVVGMGEAVRIAQPGHVLHPTWAMVTNKLRIPFLEEILESKRKGVQNREPSNVILVLRSSSGGQHLHSVQPTTCNTKDLWYHHDSESSLPVVPHDRQSFRVSGTNSLLRLDD